MKLLIVEDAVKTGDYLRQGLAEAKAASYKSVIIKYILMCL